MNDIMMFRTELKILTQKYVLKVSLFQHFLLAQTPVKLRNFNFFHVFVQVFEIHIAQKIFPKVHESSYFYGVRKNSLEHAFVIF